MSTNGPLVDLPGISSLQQFEHFLRALSREISHSVLRVSVFSVGIGRAFRTNLFGA